MSMFKAALVGTLSFGFTAVFTNSIILFFISIGCLLVGLVAND